MWPSWKWEKSLLSQEYGHVAGIDEVGRGPLAGPVTAAAVILPTGLKEPWLAEIRDSKLLTPRARETLSAKLHEVATALGIGMASPTEIDQCGIVPATRLAMSRALAKLPISPDCLLIDALRLPDVDLPQQSLIHGDMICISIAAASIVAKVHRDRLMEEMDLLYSGFGLARNKGYATPEHLMQLERLGPSPIHRYSFAPVAASETLRRSLLPVSSGS